MASTLNQKDLKIFPASNRTVESQQNNNWLTEHNLSSIIPQLTDPNKSGFVISLAPKLSFNIAGYYFEINGTAGTLESEIEAQGGRFQLGYVAFKEENNIVSAFINIKDEGNGYQYLVGDDINSTILIEASAGNIKVYSLNLFAKGATDIPATSRITFSNILVESPLIRNGVGMNMQLSGSFGFNATSPDNNIIKVENGEIASLIIDDGEL